LELQNATLELGQQKLMKQIAQLSAENEALKQSAEERKKLRSGEAKLNGMHAESAETKKLVNGYDADGFPMPPPRPKTLSENVVPSPNVITGTSLLFAETPPTTNGSRRNTTPAIYVHNPTSPVVKMSPRCEFFRIGGRGSKSGEPTELLRQSLDEESDSDESSAKETVSQDSVAGRDVVEEAPLRPRDPEVKVP
jgi:hypothetical protein